MTDEPGLAHSGAVPGGGALLYRLVERLEHITALDRPAAAVSGVAAKVIRTGGLKDLLSGTWLGHSLHPVLTDVPIGLWTSASLLDVFGGASARRPARQLVGLGVVAAVPTAAAGVSDWLDTMGGEARVGIVHAMANTGALALHTASFLARHRDRHRLGVVLGLAGAAAVTAGGYLGGHLSLARGVGVDNTAFEQGPTDWVSLDGLEGADVPDGTLASARAGDVELVLAGEGAKVLALSDRCTHRGGPLHQGSRDDGCVTCPWHGSRFRLVDGSVERGPATAPQPAYDTRPTDGGLEARRRS